MVRPRMQRPFPVFCMRAVRRVLPSLKWNEHSDFQTRYYGHFEDGCLKNLAWLPFSFHSCLIQGSGFFEALATLEKLRATRVHVVGGFALRLVPYPERRRWRATRPQPERRL